MSKCIIPDFVLLNNEISSLAKIVYGAYFCDSDFGSMPVFQDVCDMFSLIIEDEKEIEKYSNAFNELIKKNLLSPYNSCGKFAVCVRTA